MLTTLAHRFWRFFDGDFEARIDLQCAMARRLLDKKGNARMDAFQQCRDEINVRSFICAIGLLISIGMVIVLMMLTR